MANKQTLMKLWLKRAAWRCSVYGSENQMTPWPCVAPVFIDKLAILSKKHRAPYKCVSAGLGCGWISKIGTWIESFSNNIIARLLSSLNTIKKHIEKQLQNWANQSLAFDTRVCRQLTRLEMQKSKNFTELFFLTEEFHLRAVALPCVMPGKKLMSYT